MNELTLPTKEQLFGDNKLDIMDKRGIDAIITDFSILLGGFEDNNEKNGLKNRIGHYWTKTDDGNHGAYAVSLDKVLGLNKLISMPIRSYVFSRHIGARPILQYSLIQNLPLKKVMADDGVLEIEFSEYPQWVPSHDYQLVLENAFKNGTITKLEDHISTDSRKPSEIYKGHEFQELKHQIYEYKGKKYIKVKVNTDRRNGFKLSNGITYNNGDYVWIEISPIKWLVDEKQNIMLTENIIFAGVQFNEKQNYITSNFHKTTIYRFINTYLIKDLFQNNSINHKTTEQLLEEIKTLRIHLEKTTRENYKLKQENNNLKKRVRRIKDIVNE